MALLLEDHVNEKRFAELDLATGTLTAVPRSGDVDPNGRFWHVDGRVVLLYRDGITLHFRVGDVDVPLGRETRIDVAGTHPHNEVVVSHRGEERLRWKYPSQRELLNPMDWWESEDDFDLVLFASQVNADPGRRKRFCATDEEERLGELIDGDLRAAARDALAAAYEKRRVVEAMREIERWLWSWNVSDERCALCGRTTIAEIQIAVRGVRTPSPTFHEVLVSDGGRGPMLCVRCISRARRFAAAGAAAPRADAVLHEVDRAVRAASIERAAEIVAALEERCAAVSPTPFTEGGADCKLCSAPRGPLLRGAAFALCERCVRGLATQWRTTIDAYFSGRPVTQVDPFRWEKAGYVYCVFGPHRLEVWIDALPGRPIEVFPSELEHWDPPYEDIAITPSERDRIRGGVATIVSEQFRQAVAFRD